MIGDTSNGSRSEGVNDEDEARERWQNKQVWRVHGTAAIAILRASLQFRGCRGGASEEERRPPPPCFVPSSRVISQVAVRNAVPERTKGRAESKRWLAKDIPENESESALRLLRGHGEIWKGRRRIGRAQNILNKIALNNNNKIIAVARWCSAYKSLMALAISSGSHLRRRARRTKTMKRSGTVCVRDKSERYTAQDRVRGAWCSALGYVRASRTLFKRTITQDDVCLTVAMLVGRGSKNNAA